MSVPGKFLLAFALLTAAFVTLPGIPFLTKEECFLINSFGNGYPNSGDIGTYAPQTVAFAKGYFGIGDSSLYEHRAEYVNTAEKIPAMLTGLVQMLTKNIFWTQTIFTFIFIFLTFLTGYHLLTFFTVPPKIAILAMTFLLFLQEIASLGSFPLKSFLLTLGEYTRRYYTTLLTFPVFLYYLKIIYEIFFLNRAGRKSLILAGIIIGVFAYSYFFYWLFACALIFVVTIYKRKWVKGFVIIFIGLLLSGFFLYSAFFKISPTAGADMNGYAVNFKTEFASTVRTHFSIVNLLSFRRIFIFVSGIVFLNWSLKKIFHYQLLKDKPFIFLSLSLIASEIGFNSNIITGLSPELGHMFYVVGASLCYLLAIYFLALILKLTRLSKYITSLVLIIFLGLMAILIFNETAKMATKSNRCDHNTYSLINFLKNQKKELVVFTEDVILSNIIVNYTPHFTYLTPSNHSLIDYEELLTRVMVAVNLTGLDKTYITSDKIIDPGSSRLIGLVDRSFNNNFCYNRVVQPKKYFTSLKNIPFTSKDYICVIPLEIKKDLRRADEKLQVNGNPYKLDLLVIDKTLSQPQPIGYKQIFENSRYLVFSK